MSEASRKAWFERHRQINTWLTSADFSRLEAAAQDRGETTAAFAREAILERLPKDSRSGSSRLKAAE